MNGWHNIWAVVPVKPFHLAKQRLAEAYPADLRAELARAMLLDVLAVLRRVAGLAGMAVVTADHEVARLARTSGADVFMETWGGGLNAAYRSAAQRLAHEGQGGMLALPADIPAITVAEVERLLAQHRRARGLSLVPSHDRCGTNALLLTPPLALQPGFGDNSFVRHLRASRALGLDPAVLSLPGIGLDLDRPEDVQAFARAPSGTRTWRLLASAGVCAPRELETLT